MPWTMFDGLSVFVSPCVGGSKKPHALLRKQDPALPENRALNRCEVCFKQV